MEKSGRLPDARTLQARLESLKQELIDVRERSLAASRAGDFMRVARLTATAQQINGKIFELQTILHEL
jgi:hypothetical protein